ncbi:MAG: DUF3343 domain-containing protein [Chloroflexi bacterium]|nr:DUF3343 domain-containing protein [Chloroflexota bacterium]
MAEVLDGLLTFYSWHHALRAEKVLREGGFRVELIPAPRELSSNCGTALRLEHGRLDEALELLAARRVQVEAGHRFLPAAEAREPGPVGAGKPRRRWLVGA